jgi:hypothetical protein
MASLKVVSDRCDDNALKLAVVIPPRRNGEPNFGALERALRGLYSVNPDAFDPSDVPATLDAPEPPTVEFEDDDEPGNLKAGEAYREAQG